MLASAVSDVGVIVDVVVHRRASSGALQGGESVDAVAMEAYECEETEVILSENVTGPRLDMGGPAAASNRTLRRDSGQESVCPPPVVDPRLFFVCTPVNSRVAQRVFHYLNVLPFGLHRPSEVFSILGRHTSVGLVSGVSEDGLYSVTPYPSQQPLHLERVLCAPHLSYHHDNPAAGVVDPACLRRIHRENHSHRVRHALERFFQRAMARPGWGGRRASMLSSNSMTQSASALVASGTLATALPGTSKPSLTRARRRASYAPSPHPLTAKDGTSSARLTLVDAPPTSSPTATGFVPLSALAVAAAAAAAAAAGTTGDDAASPGAGVVVEEPREVLYTLADLQLPPPLALHGPVPPLRVGARVIARRFGCVSVLHIGTVIAVSFDVAYTIRYDADGGVDKGVLHSDVHVYHTIDDGDARPHRRRASHQLAREYATEQCTVRDHVVVEVAQRPQHAVVMAALGSGRYHIAVAAAPVPLIEVDSRQVLSVAPVLEGAVFADPSHLSLFRRLDVTGCGHVSWKDVRHLILSWEGFGHPLSFQRLGELQRDMRIRKRSVEPQLLSKVPVQEEEQQLTFRDFEYVLMRAENLL
ncbi:hypothetical protein NESM_000250700 [Novymonas esmeraldas]|uniref:EF-hand domain-containing protein n=1 Tax=Novymonas esmeraldas TaxID=1808958 RepID=A0AAW0FCS0_9TRYP